MTRGVARHAECILLVHGCGENSYAACPLPAQALGEHDALVPALSMRDRGLTPLPILGPWLERTPR
jgi:hypothetical protein